jgi:hypothetical protein
MPDNDYPALKNLWLLRYDQPCKNRQPLKSSEPRNLTVFHLHIFKFAHLQINTPTSPAWRPR